MSDKGTQLVDVTDPYNIFKVSIISELWPIPSLNSYDLKTYGNYLYIANNSEDNIYIKDISDPINPTGTTFIEVDPTGDPNKPAGAHNLFISDAGKLFVAAIAADGVATTHHRVWIYDLVGNETQPVLIRSWSGPDLGLPTVGGGLYYFPHDIYVKGNTAYIAWSGTGVVVVDFNSTTYDTIKVRIHQYDAKRRSGSTFRISHSTWVSSDGDYLYTTDEIGDWDNMNWAAILRIFDISNINSTPYPLEQFYDVLEDSDTGQIGNNISQIVDVPSGDSNNSIHNVLVKEPFAYISYYTKGVRVLDVSDPANILEVAYYDVPAAANLNEDTTWADGSWGIYPFAPRGNLYVSGVDWKNKTHDDFRIFKQDFIKSGNITANETWSDYAHVASTVTVNDGVTLTIEPGTIVKFADNAKLKVVGQLNAVGTSNNMIVFQSINASPAAGDWYGIEIDHTSGSGRKSTLKYCDIKHAAAGVTARSVNDSLEVSNNTFSLCQFGVYANNSDLDIKSNSFNGSSGGQYGVFIQSATTKSLIYNNNIDNYRTNVGYGIYSNASSPVIGYNDLTNNLKDGLYSTGSGHPKVYKGYTNGGENRLSIH